MTETLARPVGLSPRVERGFIWCGPVFAAIFGLGFALLAGFVPPPSPADDANQIARFFGDRTDAIRAGLLITQIGAGCVLPWGLAMASQTWPRSRLLALTIACCALANSLLGVTATLAWLTAAFRPGDISPDVVQGFNDFGWFLMVLTWFYLSLWCLAIALAVFSDKPGEPLFPRWSAYVSLWVAVLFVPAGFIAFFKSGPIAWTGMLGFYIPVVAFFAWLITMTVAMLRNTAR